MGINVPPPYPRDPFEDLERDIIEYTRALAAYVLHGLPSYEAQRVLRDATARLRALTEARESGE